MTPITIAHSEKSDPKRFLKHVLAVSKTPWRDISEALPDLPCWALTKLVDGEYEVAGEDIVIYPPQRRAA
jgi:hypothetical protein